MSGIMSITCFTCSFFLMVPFTLEWVGEGAAPAEPPVSLPSTLREVLAKQCDLTSKPKKALLRDLAGCDSARVL